MKFSSFTYLVGQGLHSMKANRLMTFASMGVLTVCMILIGAAFLLGINVDAMVSYIGDQNEMVVFMNYDLTDEDIAAADAAIRATPGVVSVTYVSQADALGIYSHMLEGYTNLQDAFADDNPFRANYRVALDDVSDMGAVSEALRGIGGVYRVNAPLELSKVFISLQTAVNYASYGLVGVLALVSVVVINNTIRLTVFARRKEINIMKLVGATNGFIRFPFFVEGVTSGFIATILASGVVCGGYYALYTWYLDHPSNISQMFGGTLVPLGQVWYLIVGAFAIFGFVLCGIGTATSIRKHLNV